MSEQNIANIVPTTELEAVNAMLAMKGDSPVENLTDPVPVNVEIALNLIRRASRGVQARGWQFNRVYGTVLMRDDDVGFQIALPANVLKVNKTVNDLQRDMDFAHRGLKLWNNLTNSDSFDGNEYVNGVTVDLTYALSFSDLPEPCRQLIILMAGQKLQEQTVGNVELSGFSKTDIQQALQNLIDSEGLTEDTNLFLNFKDQRRAKAVFDAVSRAVQSEGWHFNSRFNVTLTPDGDGHLVLPADTLRVSKALIPANVQLNVSHRGGYLFDVQNDTYVFTVDAVVDLIEYLSIIELPTVARRYIEIKATRQLQPQKNQKDPANINEGFTERDEFLARMALIDDQGLIVDNNLKDNMSVARVTWDRRSPIGDGDIFYSH